MPVDAGTGEGHGDPGAGHAPQGMEPPGDGLPQTARTAVAEPPSGPGKTGNGKAIQDPTHSPGNGTSDPRADYSPTPSRRSAVDDGAGSRKMDATGVGGQPGRDGSASKGTSPGNRTKPYGRSGSTSYWGTPPPGGAPTGGPPPNVGDAPPGGPPPGTPGQPNPKSTTAPAQQPGAVGVSGPIRGEVPTPQGHNRPAPVEATGGPAGAKPGQSPNSQRKSGPGMVRSAEALRREVDADLREVRKRLESGGRTARGSGRFTRTGDVQRLEELRQEWRDLERGWGGQYRIGEPVVGTRWDGRTEALIYDGMASPTHAFVRDAETGLRRPGTVPVGSLQNTRWAGTESDVTTVPIGSGTPHLGKTHPMKESGLVVHRGSTTQVAATDAHMLQDVDGSTPQRSSQQSKSTTSGFAASSSPVGPNPSHSRGGRGGDPPQGGDKATTSGGDDHNPPSNPDWIHKTVEWRREEFEEYARTRGYTLDEYVNEADRHLTGLLDHMSFFLQVGGDELLSALTEGRFKNQFATGTSRGILSAEVRRQTERALWGIPDQAGWEERPIYGFLHSHPDAMHPDAPQALRQYGGVTVKLSDAMRPRSTFTGGDSLDRTRWGDFPNLAPASVLHPNILAISEHMGDVLEITNADALVRSAESNVSYIEAQYFGPVTVKEIVEVIFDAEALTPPIKRLLDSHTIPYRIRQ